jgi:hypothetical protein
MARLLRPLVLSLLLAFAAAGGGGGEIDPDHGDVVVLTADTFDTFLAENDFTAIEFYAPWQVQCELRA